MSHSAVLARLLANNAQWAEDVEKAEPGFHAQSAKGQAPKVLWIGCADSRVPESVVTASRPGDIFVHRNIANQVHPDDDNILSVITYAVHHLGVEHVVVVGHTQCGGAAACYAAAASPPSSSPPDSPLGRWLEPLTEIARALSPVEDKEEALKVLVEASVKRQVANVAGTEVLEHSWHEGKDVQVHGWVFEIETGKLRDLGITIGKNHHH